MTKVITKTQKTFEEMASIYDDNAKFIGDVVELQIGERFVVEMCRKYTYSKGNVIKTDYLHGKAYVDGILSKTFKESKSGTFKVTTV